MKRHCQGGTECLQQSPSKRKICIEIRVYVAIVERKMRSRKKILVDGEERKGDDTRSELVSSGLHVVYGQADSNEAHAVPCNVFDNVL